MTAENKRGGRIPDLVLERYLLGELPAERAAEVKRRLAEDPAEAERLEELRRDNAATLIQHPPRQVAEQIRRRAGRPSRSSPRTWMFVLTPALAATAAFALMIRADPAGVPIGVDCDPADPACTETILTKGSPHLVIHRNVAGRSERMQPGSTAKARDLLQVSYRAFGAPYGVIFSIDGRGSVTLHYPEQPGQSQSLLKGGEISLPRAYELDDAPEFERFFFVTAKAPIDIDAVLAAAQSMARDPVAARQGSLRMPDGIGQWTMTLHKE